MKKLKIDYLLWLSLALALIGSLWHLSDVFASMDGHLPLGWVQAIAVDAGVFALAYGVKNRGGKLVKAGLVLFVLISIYGNLVYGLGHTGNVWPWLTWVKPIILAASLPVLVLFLAELLAGNSRDVPTVEPDLLAELTASLAELKAKFEATEKPDTTKKDAFLEFIQANPMATYPQIAKGVNRSLSTVKGYAKQYQEAGVLVRNGHGWEVKE